MDQMYEIPAGDGNRLSVGNWVEIFEAYGRVEGEAPIRVQTMRVGGQVLVFDQVDGRHPGTKALRPHEGEVIFIDRDPDRTRFSIRMRPQAA